MDQGLELIIAHLEMLEIEVFNIIYNPGNVGNWIFRFSGRLEILEIGFF